MEEFTMKVLVAVDQSPESQMALRYTCHLMEQADARIDAVYVRPDETDIVPESVYGPFVGKEELAKWLEQQQENVEEQVLGSCWVCEAVKTPCTPRIVTGDPADEILHIAHSEGYDLVVLGASEHSAIKGFLLGTVHAKVLHHAQLPVLIVRNFRPIKRVVVAFRGSDCDQAAMEFIAPLFFYRKPEITILHISEKETRQHDGVAQACLMNGEKALSEFDHAPVAKMACGNFVEELLKDVAAERYDLIVMGAYGIHRPKYAKLISDDALNIARLTTRPVLVYREKTQHDGK
uniref:Universal stress protein n=1 Tax=Desulfatirhabdium butyrativorans TaxID=340467 RepID=A0A7C4RSK5_9BACT